MGKGAHSDDDGTPYDQPLEEMEFLRSACSAAQRGELDKLTRMLQRKPHLVDGDGVGGNSGYTPLHYASREGQVECAALLLRSGADVNRATAAGGATPLHRAAYTARKKGDRKREETCCFKQHNSLLHFFFTTSA